MGLVRGWIIENTLYILLALATLASYLWLMYFRKRLSMSGLAAFGLALLHTVLGLLSVKLFAFLENGEGGMSLFGGVFFMPLFYLAGAKLTKRNFAEVADVFTVCMPITLLFARINCLVGGCCYGIPFFGSAEQRWPTRQLEIVFYLLFALWLGRRVLQNKTHGAAYPIYMMTYGVFRFIIEFLRANPALWGPFHIAHVWALLSALVGAALCAVISRKYAPRESKETRK